jgi:hypothetical protein
MTGTDLRLVGLEPDNLLAIMALLGLLRALETAERPNWHPRALWDLDTAPLRPTLQLRETVTREAVCEAAAEGLLKLAKAHDFGGLAKLKLSPDEARERLTQAAQCAADGDRRAAEMWSALVSDAAIKAKADAVERTPFCLLDVAQTSFLKNLAEVCVLPKRGDRQIYFSQAIDRALFSAWRREDQTPSFRWDPMEDSRHAYRWAAPTDEKQGVQHGANMLAAIGLPVLTVVPYQRGREVRLQVLGGDTAGGFSFAWPIWRDPASLSSIRGLLSHPGLRSPGALAHLGLDQVRVSRRISPSGSKYANFTPAQVLDGHDADAPFQRRPARPWPGRRAVRALPLASTTGHAPHR